VAPEILSGKDYDGSKADIFSLGVIIFALVRGNFPFVNAKYGDRYYNHILRKQFYHFWVMNGS
jgi:serine/threonine protein kinase